MLPASQTYAGWLAALRIFTGAFWLAHGVPKLLNPTFFGSAGDMAGMLRGLPPEECLRIASAVGASCVRAIGTTAGVFTRQEMEEFLSRNELRVERA